MDEDILKVIEDNYPIEDVKCNKESIWPLFRLKLTEGIRNNSGIKSRLVKVDWKLVLKLFVTIFYGFENWFIIRRFDVWAFSSSERRKKIGTKYVDRVLGGIVETFPNTLIFENPLPFRKHYSREKTDSRYIVSLTLLRGVTKLISLLLTLKVKISNEEVLKTVLEENNLNINYKKVVSEYLAQYFLFSIILNFVRPKVVFFVYSASSMGYINALKKRKIPVIELQHGVINKSHFGYNVYKDFGSNLFPDYLFTYGNYESEVFDCKNYFIKKDRVIPVGYYYLDKMIEKEPDFVYLNNLKTKYNKVITYSFQDPFEEYIIEFLIDSAKLDDMICYLLVPRDLSKNYSDYNLPHNIYVVKDLNVYDCIKISDFHSTINSTCAIESLCLGVRNIMFNFRNLAKSYYDKVLDERYTCYVNTPKDFIKAIHNSPTISNEEIINDSNRYIKKDFIGTFYLVMNRLNLVGDIHQ